MLNETFSVIFKYRATVEKKSWLKSLSSCQLFFFAETREWRSWSTFWLITLQGIRGHAGQILSRSLSTASEVFRYNFQDALFDAQGTNQYCSIYNIATFFLIFKTYKMNIYRMLIDRFSLKCHIVAIFVEYVPTLKICWLSLLLLNLKQWCDFFYQ